MNTLYLLVGISGSGKSTWAHKNMKENDIYISRDVIRFSMLKDEEDYFAHEDEVVKEFIRQINTAIAIGNVDIYVDATHLNEKSRNKILDKLDLGHTHIIVVNFNISLEVALERNDKRTGRAFVPKEVIRRQYSQLELATLNEKYAYEDIIEVNE